MSRRARTSGDTPDLFNEDHSARIREARQRVRLARARNGGVSRAQRLLRDTVLDVLREELGLRRK